MLVGHIYEPGSGIKTIKRKKNRRFRKNKTLL